MLRSGGGYQVLYLLASASFTVFAWAGGFDACAQGAAVTQPCITGAGTPNDGAEASITAAETPNSGAEAPVIDGETLCSDQWLLYLLASVSFAVLVWAADFDAYTQDTTIAEAPCSDQ